MHSSACIIKLPLLGCPGCHIWSSAILTTSFSISAPPSFQGSAGQISAPVLLSPRCLQATCSPVPQVPPHPCPSLFPAPLLSPIVPALNLPKVPPLNSLIHHSFIHQYLLCMGNQGHSRDHDNQKLQLEGS